MSRLRRLAGPPVLAGAVAIALGAPAGASQAPTAATARSHLSAVLAAPAAAGRPARAAKAATVEKVVNCAGKAVARPASFVITCADDGWMLDKIHWTSWMLGRATATATFTVNLCTPTCAAGKLARYPASVALSGVEHLKSGPVYTELRWSYQVKGKLKHKSFALITGAH